VAGVVSTRLTITFCRESVRGVSRTSLYDWRTANVADGLLQAGELGGQVVDQLVWPQELQLAARAAEQSQRLGLRPDPHR
jgi:hypothetical protein